MARIVLKADPIPFRDMVSGNKLCEVRREDTHTFRYGDILHIRETVHTGEEMAKEGGPMLAYTGEYILRRIIHVQRGYGLPEGIAVLSLRDY